MPATQKIIGPRGRDFWDAFDPEDYKTVALALKEEFQRPEPAYEIHFAATRSPNWPSRALDWKFSFHCLSNCLVFLLRGVLIIDCQGALIEPGYAYAVRDEKWIGLGGNTTIFVMEEGEMKGICAKKTRESQEKWQAEKASLERKQMSLWNKYFSKFRKPKLEPENTQCAVQ